jgi:hypothetical protein
MATTDLPPEQLSEREQNALFLALDDNLAWDEHQELEDFLNNPAIMPSLAAGRALSVVNRILEARAAGEHIA